MAPARVTIGMPAYNASRYLAETIKTVQAQTVAPWRLVICDNASTDDTVEIAKGFAAADDRISVLTSEVNGGQVTNFRKAFEASDAPAFMWLSDDDLLHPSYLELCLDALDGDPELIAAYTAAREIDEHGQLTGSYVDGPHPERRVDKDPAVRLKEAVVAEPALCLFGVHRTDALGRTDLLAPFVGSDRVLAGHVAMLGPVRKIPTEAFDRRTHSASYSNSVHSNRARFRSYCGHNPSYFRPLGIERIWRLSRAVGRTDLSPAERLRCQRVVFTTFGWLTVKMQFMLALRFASQSISRRTGRDVQIHRTVVQQAKRVKAMRGKGVRRLKGPGNS
jgi:glycosyltransferase involved in cell wall biosynthesis